jgi:hypothetical protein
MNEARRKKIRNFRNQNLLIALAAIVGITAGGISVIGFVYSFLGSSTPKSGFGDIVAVVQDAKTRNPVSDATVEILTGENAVVTTVISKDDGRARRRVKEGGYTLRVMHPRFGVATRKVQVDAGQTAEIQVALSPLPPPRASGSVPSSAAQTITEGVGAVKKFFRALGN